MNLAVPLFSSYTLNLILGGQMEASIIVVRVNSSWGRYKKHRIILNNINQKNFMKKLIRKFWDYYTVFRFIQTLNICMQYQNSWKLEAENCEPSRYLYKEESQSKQLEINFSLIFSVRKLWSKIIAGNY